MAEMMHVPAVRPGLKAISENDTLVGIKVARGDL
jgi:hypothetical protein